MSSNKTEENRVKAYLINNLPSLIFHFFLSVLAVLAVLITGQAKGIFFSILIMYVVFGLFLKNQGTVWKNVQSVSMIMVINLILYTVLPLAIPQLLMFYSLPYIYLGIMNGQLIYLAIILPSICMLIGLYVKILITNFKK
ncbi:hypothetical protein [Oceanobacillus sp. J11TS1]|uniref:hypothetical protein n=1 Tax=Oceanobacillus sp. J11TS1 TaxID=2807191 RepID=UPI001B24FECD|nr:hypothetical protein [Oceanobacillus sp. J11TS1]GIO21672.1 hypothetical protein J11TS1_02530 [Oceanobacillus sp. J11TS1]